MERLVFVVLQEELAKASFVADADVDARLSVLIKKRDADEMLFHHGNSDA